MLSQPSSGNRVSKAITGGTTTTVVNDAYQSGQLISESDGRGTLLATFTCDANGTPSSVQVGSDLTTAPRCIVGQAIARFFP